MYADRSLIPISITSAHRSAPALRPVAPRSALSLRHTLRCFAAAHSILGPLRCVSAHGATSPDLARECHSNYKVRQRGRFCPQKPVATATSLEGSKNSFRSFIYGLRSTSSANFVKIGPVDVEIIGLKLTFYLL